MNKSNNDNNRFTETNLKTDKQSCIEKWLFDNSVEDDKKRLL